MKLLSFSLFTHPTNKFASAWAKLILAPTTSTGTAAASPTAVPASCGKLDKSIVTVPPPTGGETKVAKKFAKTVGLVVNSVINWAGVSVATKAGGFVNNVFNWGAVKDGAKAGGIALIVAIWAFVKVACCANPVC